MSDEQEQGTYRSYVDRSFNKPQLARIAQINSIISEYEPYGLKLTLRQLYYQFVARGLFANDDREYNKLKHILSEGRIAGLISWTAIEDRGRNLMGHETQDSPATAIKKLRDSYKLDLWKDQPMRCEVWIEKQALEGVIASICDTLRVNYFATKGYNSQSEQWSAGRRFASYYQRGQRPVVLHLGDHDPSGIDMTRDNRERLSLFTGVDVHVVRIALNLEQIEQLNPPPNPAKDTDARFEDYASTYFPDTPLDEVSSWELDALDPRYIQNLISTSVAQFRDETIWERSVAQEASDIDDLDNILEEHF